MDTKIKNNLKLLFMVLFFGYLIWSSYRLMANPEQQPIQMGFALIYHVGLLMAIYKRVYAIKILEKEDILEKVYKHFQFITTTLFLVFGAYSTYIFLLAGNEIKSTFFSSIWLLLLIFSFQSISFLIMAYQLKEKMSSKFIGYTFLLSYMFLSIIFGWTSAFIAHNILILPAQQDLFLVAYGVLILPILFIIYFDRNFNYLTLF